jgi:hypothetical protein
MSGAYAAEMITTTTTRDEKWILRNAKMEMMKIQETKNNNNINSNWSHDQMREKYY